MISSIANSQNYNEPPVLENARELIDKGISSYDEDKYEEALTYYNQISENDTAFPLALYESALTYRMLKKPQDAIRKLNKGLSLTTGLRRSYYEMLGSSYDEAGDFQKSIKSFNDALKEFPAYDFFYNEMGITYFNHKEGDSALANLIKAVELNPIRAVNHLKLSGFLLKNNQLVPAMMAFLVYSALETNKARAFKQLTIYEKILTKEESVSADSVMKFNFNSEQFSEIDQIVKSNMAVSKDYKVPVKINYPYLIKNFYVLMEKIKADKSKKDIWNSFYIPVLKNIYDEKKFEPFVLTIFSSVDKEDVQKEVKKKKKSIESFDFWLVSTIYDNYMKNRATAMNGKLISGLHTYNNDGSLSSIGNYDEVKKINTGMYYYFYKNGNIRAAGEYDGLGKKVGEWKYYYEEGPIRSVELVRDGKANGPYEFYYLNGNVKEKGNYLDGELNGELDLFYSGGALKKIVNYKNGKLDGVVHEYTSEGMLNQVYNISAENGYDGETKKYYQNGTLNYVAIYKKGMFDGGYKTYFQNTGNLKEEGTYLNDKRTGTLKTYFESGKIYKVVDGYSNGKLNGAITVYFENGKISEKTNYENDMYQGESAIYDSTGRLYAKFVYEKNDLVNAVFFDKDNKMINEVKGSNKQFYFKNYYSNGMLYEEGNVVGNMREGLWKQYYRNGNIHSEYNYVKNVLEGDYKTYYIHGNLKTEVNYTSGNKEGLYKEYYSSGILKQQGWYVKGIPEQHFYNYSSSGKISSDVYVFHDERQGPMRKFDVTGKLNYIEYYEKGLLYKVESYDTLGVLVNKSELKKGTGKLAWYYPNGQLNTEIEYKDGYENGVESIWHSNRKPSATLTYRNGMKEGSYKLLDSYGKVKYESFYKNDLLDSIYIQYDFDGNKTSQMMYNCGNLNGERKWFYPNGKTDVAGAYKDDSRNGVFNYYSPDGLLMIQRKYVEGTFVSYTYQNASGQYVPSIPVDDKMQKVIAYYSNGKKSIEYNVVNGVAHGVMKAWYPDGAIMEENSRFHGDYDGEQKEFYPNGNVQSDEWYNNDKLNGECRFYFENGKTKRITNYVNDLKHGHEIVFDKSGTVISDIVFYNGEPVK